LKRAFSAGCNNTCIPGAMPQAALNVRRQR
jgi:hypothetical protein